MHLYDSQKMTIKKLNIYHRSICNRDYFSYYGYNCYGKKIRISNHLHPTQAEPNQINIDETHLYQFEWNIKEMFWVLSKDLGKMKPNFEPSSKFMSIEEILNLKICGTMLNELTKKIGIPHVITIPNGQRFCFNSNDDLTDERYFSEGFVEIIISPKEYLAFWGRGKGER